VVLSAVKVIEVGVPQRIAWAFLRDVPRLTACLRSVSDLEVLEPDRRYSAVVSDKIGPFRLQVPVRIEVLSLDPPRRIAATITGGDSRGQARVNGTLEATVEPAGDGTRVTLGIRTEVLGRLAGLGAAAMHRRTDELFADFVQRAKAELDATPLDEWPRSEGRAR